MALHQQELLEKAANVKQDFGIRIQETEARLQEAEKEARQKLIMLHGREFLID